MMSVKQKEKNLKYKSCKNNISRFSFIDFSEQKYREKKNPD